MAKKWSDEEKTYLRKITPGRHHAEITELMNKKFDREFTIGQIKGAIKRYKLLTGFTGRFEKGHVPYNQGKKGICAKGCEKTWFKKGNIPHNKKPIGAEVINSDGYTMVKVAEPNVWKFKHRLIWEKANGPIPKNHNVIFIDQDRGNLSLDNLALLSHSDMVLFNKLVTDNAGLNKVGITVAKLQSKIISKSREGNK